MNTAMASTPINADEVFAALETWIKQRPGLDPANYGLHPEQHRYDSPRQVADNMRTWRQEVRSIGKDRTRALKALDEARGLMPRKPELLADAFRAFSGRLEWVPPPSNSNGNTTGLIAGRLSYTTGQYFPTEYRKAAVSVLETYIAAWRQWHARENPATFEYRTMDDVLAANQAIGNHFFSRDSMRFFKCKIESGVVARHDEAGRPTRARFITSEKGPDEVRRYTVREAQPDGTIDTIGEFRGYRTRDAARAAILKTPEGRS